MRSPTPVPPDEPTPDERELTRAVWASLSIGSAVYLAALAGLLVGLLVFALPAVPDRWAALPLASWLATSAGVVALWLWWPRRRKVARGEAGPLAGGTWRSGGTDWSQLPMPLAPIYFLAAALVTALIAGTFLGFTRLAVAGLPASIGWVGAGSGAAVWLGLFALWLWWPQRRRLATLRRRRRREARRRLAAIRRGGPAQPA